jgi:hypothetical protein
MYMWKNIFHVIPTWHRDILRIVCPHHQNIPNIFILVHKLMLTLMCSLRNIVVNMKVRNMMNEIMASNSNSKVGDDVNVESQNCKG